MQETKLKDALRTRYVNTWWILLSNINVQWDCPQGIVYLAHPRAYYHLQRFDPKNSQRRNEEKGLGKMKTIWKKWRF